MNALSQTNAAATNIDRGQAALVVILRISGWLATTVMATLGVATLFFLVLGSFTLSGMMLQVDNLASRFLAADAARREQFELIACSVLAISFTMIAFFRRASLRDAFDVTGDDA